MARHDQLRRDVGQLLWVGFEGTKAPPALLRKIAAGDVGAVILFKRNLTHSKQPFVYAGMAANAGGTPGLVAQAMAGAIRGDRVADAAVVREVLDVDALVELNRALHAAAPAHDPLLIAVDQEGGRVQRVRAPSTMWPPMAQFDELGDAEAKTLARQVGKALGTELSALGFDVDFAPVLDVHTNPANPIIGNRAFAAEAERAATRALAFAVGLEDAGLVSCGKHFPGHGDTSTDSHLELPRLDHDLERLRAVELLPFRRAAAAGVPMLMTAHVVFAALDSSVPATLSRRVMHDLLRVELGYKGVVVSDDLDMNAISRHYGAADAAVRAIEAGCDVLLLCRDEAAQRAARDGLIHAAEKRADLRTRIAQAAASVRALKGQHAAKRRRADPSILGCPEHLALADHLATA